MSGRLLIAVVVDVRFMRATGGIGIGILHRLNKYRNCFITVWATK